VNATKSQFLTSIIGVVIGTGLAASLVVIYLKHTGFDVEIDKINKILNPTPVQAVMDKLPQVAIIGQKPGPADSTEVFIQVPGVLNMQSVYVLDDNETVISGFILPDIQEGSGVPGGQLEMPTGQPTVDPRAPRQHREQIMSMSGQAPDTLREQNRQPSERQSQPQAPTPQPQAPTPNVAQKPVPVPAPSISNNTEKAAIDRKTQQIADSSGESQQDAPAPSASAEATAQSQPNTQTSSPAKDYLVVSDLVGRGAFRSALSEALSNRDVLSSVRQAKGDSEQQAAYLDLVKSLPSVQQGSGPKNLYVLFDPNCPVCHRYYESVKLDAQAGRVTVHWIPVTIFPERQSSITAGAELLEVRDSLGQTAASETLAGMMTQAGFVDEIGSRYTDSEASASYLDQIITNTGALVMARAETPLIVYEGTGGELVVEAGMPQGGYLSTVKSEG
jgi:hypothetical protein